MDDFEQLDYYELLEISRSASADEIKQAYRQQMRRYHPDRVAAAPPEEQAYASRRALRINEAYQTLSDFSARTAYNRSLSGQVASPSRPQPSPPKPRDHQAELYDQARAHLDAGRALQAAATLRELQRLNPFYRDSAALLAQAEAAVGQRPKPAPPPASSVPDSGRRTLLVGGIGGALLVAAGAVAWWTRRPAASASTLAAPTPSTAALSVAPTSPPTSPPTAAPTSPPTSPPTAAPTSPPTSPPTAAPTSPPTVAPTETPVTLAEEGRLAYAEGFRGNSWPSTAGNGWSVAEGGGFYMITTDPGVGNIWAYRTSPAGEDMLIGVDVEVRGGEAGLILRFSDANNYLAFFVNPAAGSFRLEQRLAGRASSVVAEAHPAVLAEEAGPNRLVARLEGDRIGLRVNGQPVADQSLAAPPTGPRYGLVAVSGGGPVEARFTDLALRELAA